MSYSFRSIQRNNLSLKGQLTHQSVWIYRYEALLDNLVNVNASYVADFIFVPSQISPANSFYSVSSQLIFLSFKDFKKS